jgi:hypothetical protein
MSEKRSLQQQKKKKKKKKKEKRLFCSIPKVAQKINFKSIREENFFDFFVLF